MPTYWMRVDPLRTLFRDCDDISNERDYADFLCELGKKAPTMLSDVEKSVICVVGLIEIGLFSR
jgi:hypothetical protein